VNRLDAVFDSPLPSAPLAEFRNHTPFATLYFQTVDPGDAVFHVAVVRITYTLRRIASDGTLTFADEQTPLATEDAYYGAVSESSVKWESDLAPYKPRCDVLLVNARAIAPEGRAYPTWPVRLEVGGWQKTLFVTGARRLVREGKGSYRVTDPAPAREVELVYENAFGGQNRWPDPPVKDEPPELWRLDERNPVGCGFMDADWVKRADPKALRAPQIELPDRPFGGEAGYPVCGFGAIARPWLPRRTLAGTYDDAWKATRWPKLPLDHDYGYWNCAPPDQQIDYPKGGEAIVLHNLHAKTPVQVRLPTHNLYCLVRLSAGPVLPKPLNLDTLVIDLGRFELIATHRALVAAEAGVRVIEARLAMTEGA
jgi:hypothetical protein